MFSPEMVDWMEKVSYRMPHGPHMYCRGGVPLPLEFLMTSYPLWGLHVKSCFTSDMA